MNVGLITYQTGHRKTLEVARILLAKNYRVTLFAFPFHFHSTPAVGDDRVPDHPSQVLGLAWQDIFKGNEVEIINMPGWNPAHSQHFNLHTQGFPSGLFLHCTAKIVPPAFIGDRIILNSHPGLLPQNRGVDALKWSIINNWPIGQTLHIIDARIDCGAILTRWRTPLFPNDTLEEVFLRTYNGSIRLLAGFEEFIENRHKHWLVDDKYPLSRHRIPVLADRQLETIWQEGRHILIQRNTDKLFHPHKSNT